MRRAAGSVENFRGWAYSGAGSNCGLLFAGRAGRMPAGIPYRRRGSGEPGRLRGGISSRRSGGEITAPALASLVWDTVRWPLLALLLGFTALGLLGLPLLFVVRGFLLAFSIASFVRLFGGVGCLLALLVFGVSGALSVPVLFVLGVQGLLAARVLAGRVWGMGKPLRPMENSIFFRCGRLCRRAVCESVAGLLCSAWPGHPACGDVPEPIVIHAMNVLDGWIINQVMRTI